jgi:hypothetical protein
MTRLSCDLGHLLAVGARAVAEGIQLRRNAVAPTDKSVKIRKVYLRV